MTLKVDVKEESGHDVMKQYRGGCACKKCGLPKPLKLRDIWKTIKQKDPGSFVDEKPVKWVFRWKRLLKINPRLWSYTIRTWMFEDELAYTLSKEIQKEIDKEIIQALLGAANGNKSN